MPCLGGWSELAVSLGKCVMAPESPQPENAKSKREVPAQKSGLEALKTLGKYEIVRKIGAGGMGAVFLARDTQLKRTVALKVLPREKAENPTLVKRFHSEARTAARLRHENIVTVFEAGEASGYLYIALEFVDGIDVHDLIHKRGVVTVKRSVDIIRQVTKALQHAQEQNIVHRDIKPSNLLITRDGTVKLTDMGLARSVDETSKTNITRAGTTVGTVDYMAPEQARSSKSADIRSDIYSLGCAWFHILTGRPPFPDGNLLEKLNAHVNSPRPDPREFNESVPESVVAVMHRMMEKKPADRYQTPAELLDDLDNDTLTRDSVGDHLLAALAEDEKVEEEKAEPKPVESRSTEKASPSAIPPRSSKRRKKKDEEEEEKKGWARDWNSLKIAAVAAAAIACFAGLGYIAARYSGVFDAPLSGSAGRANPFQQSQGDGQMTSASEDEKTDSNETASDKSDATTNDSPESSDEPVAEIAPDPEMVSDNTAQTETPADSSPPVGRINTEDWHLFLPPASDVARDGERELLPTWIGQTPTQMPEGLTTVLVSEDCLHRPGLPTLHNALEQLPRAGGIVELDGNGPFFLRPVELTGRASVWIRASNDSCPVVVLLPGAQQESKALMTVAKGALTVENVHFVVVASQFPSSDVLSFVCARAADFAAVNCSWTLLGTRPGQTTAIVLEDLDTSLRETLERPSRCLLDHVVVRGDSIRPLNVDQAATHVTACNSVFATRRAPVMTLATPETISDQRTSSGKPLARQRTIQFFSTVALTENDAFVLRAGPGLEELPETHVETVNCVLGSIGTGTPSSALISLPSWPRRQPSDSNASHFANLTWLARHTVAAGWAPLIRMDQDSTSAVTDALGWREVWQSPLDGVEFRANQWSETKSRPIEWLPLESFDVSQRLKTNVPASDGASPGCDIDRLVVPPDISLKRAELFCQRVRIPSPGRGKETQPRTISLDLTTQDLGEFLSEEDVPDGTVIVASGKGNCLSRPIAIRNKSIRIEFHHTGTEPLTLRPVISTTVGTEENDAFITVEDGEINLVNGSIAFPAGKPQLHPHWFLSVTNGSFSLQDCQVNGPVSEHSRCRGLIRWTGDAGRHPELDAGLVSPSGTILGSYLLSPGPVLESNIRQKTLCVADSLLVSLKSSFRFHLDGEGAVIAGISDIRRTTLSARSSFFDIRPAGLKEPIKEPLTFLVDHTVFAPPVPTETGEAPVASLMSLPTGPSDARPVDWWGDSNSFAQTLEAHASSDASAKPSSSPQMSVQGWVGQWGAGQVARPATGQDAVSLEAELPKASELKPESFRLRPSVSGTGKSAANASSGVKRIEADGTRTTNSGVRRQSQEMPSRPTDEGTSEPNRRRVRVNTKTQF